MLCCRQGESVIESDAMLFLSEHGFDFNRQITNGVPYYAACDHTDNVRFILLN